MSVRVRLTPVQALDEASSAIIDDARLVVSDIGDAHTSVTGPITSAATTAARASAASPSRVPPAAAAAARSPEDAAGTSTAAQPLDVDAVASMADLMQKEFRVSDFEEALYGILDPCK